MSEGSEASMMLNRVRLGVEECLVSDDVVDAGLAVSFEATLTLAADDR